MRTLVIIYDDKECKIKFAVIEGIISHKEINGMISGGYEAINFIDKFPNGVLKDDVYIRVCDFL